MATHPIEPDHPIAPLTVYGPSKAAGEKAIQENHSAWCIARTSWFFGTSGTCFPEKILRVSESRQELTVVADQFGSPTYTRDLVRADRRGILHVTNAGSYSWFTFPREVLRQAGRVSIGILPITTAQAGCPTKCPAYSVLSPVSLYVHNMMLRSRQEATGAYVGELRGAGQTRLKLRPPILRGESLLRVPGRGRNKSSERSHRA